MIRFGRFRGRRELERALGALPTPPPPGDLARRIKAAIPDSVPVRVLSEAEPRPAPLELERAWFPRRGLVPSLAVHAAVALVAVAAGWWLRSTFVVEPRLPWAARAAAGPGRAAVPGAAAGVLSSGEGAYVDASRQPVSSFLVDPGTSSFDIVREFLKQGYLPPADAVRAEEFVNAFQYGDPAPRDRDVALYAEGGPTPFLPGADYRLLRFSLAARAAETPQTLGTDAHVAVEFNPRVVDRYRLVGYDDTGQGPRPVPEMGGEIPAGMASSAVYEVQLRDERLADEVARLDLSYRSTRELLVRETRALNVAELAASWDAAPPSLRLAALAAEFAKALHGVDVPGGDLSEVAKQAQALVRDLPGRADVAQFVMLTAVAVHANRSPGSGATIFAARRDARVVVTTATDPVLVHRVDPVYPARARSAGISGKVLLQALVDENGHVLDVDVLRSIPALDEAAVVAVREFRYTPARFERTPVKAYVTVEVEFRPQR